MQTDRQTASSNSDTFYVFRGREMVLLDWPPWSLSCCHPIKAGVLIKLPYMSKEQWQNTIARNSDINDEQEVETNCNRAFAVTTNESITTRSWAVSRHILDL